MVAASRMQQNLRKTDEAPAAYTVLEAEARVVQRIYEMSMLGVSCVTTETSGPCGNGAGLIGLALQHRPLRR